MEVQSHSCLGTGPQHLRTAYSARNKSVYVNCKLPCIPPISQEGTTLNE